jgi:hypothetical protein
MRVLRFDSPAPRAAGIGVVVSAVLALATAACSTVEFGEPVPLPAAPPNPAIRERILAFEADARPHVLGMTSFVGPDERPVYLFTPMCCDQFTRLYDAEGRFICAPSGGFSGAGDGTCPAWVHGLERRPRLPARPGEQPQSPR